MPAQANFLQDVRCARTENRHRTQETGDRPLAQLFREYMLRIHERTRMIRILFSSQPSGAVRIIVFVYISTKYADRMVSSCASCRIYGTSCTVLLLIVLRYSLHDAPRTAPHFTFSSGLHAYCRPARIRIGIKAQCTRIRIRTYLMIEHLFS